MEIGTPSISPLTRVTARKVFPRWCIGRIKGDLLNAGALLKAWTSPPVGSAGEEVDVRLVDGAMRKISDFSMPRRSAFCRSLAY